MNELRKDRIAYLKRKQNGNLLKPKLLDKITNLSFDTHLNKLVDQEESFKLHDHFKGLTKTPKILNLKDVKKEDVVTSLASFDKNTWNHRGILFLHHFLDVGSFAVDLEFVLTNLFDLCLKLDGDSIYYLDIANNHGIYFDYNENNFNPDNCFDLEIW